MTFAFKHVGPFGFVLTEPHFCYESHPVRVAGRVEFKIRRTRLREGDGVAYPQTVVSFFVEWNRKPKYYHTWMSLAALSEWPGIDFTLNLRKFHFKIGFEFNSDVVTRLQSICRRVLGSWCSLDVHVRDGCLQFSAERRTDDGCARCLLSLPVKL